MQRIRVKAISLGERHSFIQVSRRIGYITQSLKRAGKGGRLAKVVSAYLGFDNYNEAAAAAQDLVRNFPKIRIEVRKAQRLTTAFEVKFSHPCAEEIVWRMIEQIPTTGQRVTQHVERRLQVVRTMPSVQPDAPSDRYAAMQMSRSGGRTLVTAGRFTVGID
jgi:hypothetical protein